MASRLEFKSDRFKKNRGGYSRWLSLACEKCQNQLGVYQKDGPGILKRLYLDRIVKSDNFQDDKNLICPKCKTLLGVKIVYEKEKRPAYRLFAGAISKKVIKGDKLLK